MRLIDAKALHDRFYELTKFKRDEQTNDYVARRYVKISDALRMINDAPTEETDRAIEELDKALIECINELCLYCGKYKMEHMGACSGCKWYVIKQI